MHPHPTTPTNSTVTAAERSRFEMFVRLNTNQKFRFYGGQTTWTYRGDRYGDQEPEKQLRSLINNLKNHSHKYLVAEVYDTSLPKENGERLILKIYHGTVKVNFLHYYADLLKHYAVPEFLKP